MALPAAALSASIAVWRAALAVFNCIRRASCVPLFAAFSASGTSFAFPSAVAMAAIAVSAAVTSALVESLFTAATAVLAAAMAAAIALRCSACLAVRCSSGVGPGGCSVPVDSEEPPPHPTRRTPQQAARATARSRKLDFVMVDLGMRLKDTPHEELKGLTQDHSLPQPLWQPAPRPFFSPGASSLPIHRDAAARPHPWQGQRTIDPRHCPRHGQPRGIPSGSQQQLVTAHPPVCGEQPGRAPRLLTVSY